MVLDHLSFNGSTLFTRISRAVVLNNGFSTSSFAVERRVKQGDPLSAYLFIIALQVLCVNIRNSNHVCGITVDNEEIKVSLFTDDLAGFLKDDLSLTNFLKLIEDYGTFSVNHEKSELLLLGNQAYTENFSNKDILFGICGCEDEIFVNHILLLAKQYLYSCRPNKCSPFIRVLNSEINTVFLIETMIARSDNKLETHNMKWSKYKSD